jgi:hypothetical protein
MACLIIAPCVAMARPVAAETASWTYAIFGNADNNLEMYWDSKSLPWLKLVPASSSVNIVVLLDRESTSTVEVLKINGGVVTVVETYGEMDLGDPAVVTWWINRATTLFPSTYFAFNFWDHGYGWKYISDDFTSGNRISMPELQSAISNAGKRIDVLAFDACNMANAEVVYQVAKTNLVTYVIASEETVPGDGFPYDKMLTRLVNNPAMLPRDLSIALVDGWADYYKTQRWASSVNLAAIDVEGMESTIGTFTTWTARMSQLLPSYEGYYATALKNSHKMWGTSYFVDTYDYGYTLLITKGVTDATLRTATQNMENAVLSYVVKVWNAAKMTDCKGITFYWGTGSDWTAGQADYLNLAFSVDTGWGSFLTAYNA